MRTLQPPVGSRSPASKELKIMEMLKGLSWGINSLEEEI